MDMDRVVKVLLRGLKKLAEIDPPVFESIISLQQKRLIHQAKALVHGFYEVVAESRSVYLESLQKIGQPNLPEIQKELKDKLNASAREARQYLRIISVKAEVLLQDIDEQSLNIDSDIKAKLKKISEIKVKDLDQVVNLIVGIVDESIDSFGAPIFS